MRSYLLAARIGLASLAFIFVSPVSAHPPAGGGSHPGGLYGNGAHDLAPHWHKTHTPFGPVYWYGNGPHDLMPHNHTITPWGGVRSYSYTPFGPTKSYNGFPANRGFGTYPGYYS